MRRVGIFLLAAIALVAMVGPVSAQPKVTITGFVDNVTSWTKNMSVVDINPARNSDKEWYARTRVRPDITAEVGTTKFVLGLEIDSVWGQTAGQDTNVCLSAACPNTPQRSGASSGWDLNTDVQGTIEVKWAYTEFDLPIIPIPTRFRLGAQPWQATYKLAVLANGDFAGVHVTNQWSPMIRSHFTYAQAEESSTGPKDGFIRGDDIIFITSVEVTPFKGLDIRPIFSYATINGITNTAMRQARGGVAVTATTTFETCPGTAGPGTGACAPTTTTQNEDRFTIGVDARWRFGAFSLDPTVFYQFGSREQVRGGVADTLHRDAWFVDLRGGWQAGPLLLELAGIYTTGNKAEDRIDIHPSVAGSSATTQGRGTSKLKFYEPISTDTSFYATWAEIWALGIDYFNIIRSGATGLNPGVAIGYDKYGLMRVGARASYALTPAFTLRTGVTASWTAEEVDTSSTLAAATGLTPGDANGDARYLGTELNLGFQWRFVPNVALDVVGSYMWAGEALTTHLTTSGTGVAQNGRGPQDIQAITARVRYSW
jgi:hypothetical protein